MAQLCVDLVGNNRVPAPPVLSPDYPIQAAMDNFNWLERTLSGKGITNDTVMVIFQNIPTGEERPKCDNAISKRCTQERERH